MKKIFTLILLLLFVASSAFGWSEDDWLVPGGLGSTMKGASIQYSLNAPFTVAALTGMVNSYDFDSSNDYIALGDHDAFSPAAISICAWINPDTVGGTDPILSKRRGANEIFFFLSSGQIISRFYDSGGTAYVGRASPTSSSMAVNTWQFVCTTFSNTGAGGTSADIDNLQNCVATDNADNSSGVYTQMGNTIGAVDIGDDGSSSNWFDGKMMNVSFWNTNITNAVCLAAMAAGNYSQYVANGGDSTNLVAWWDLQTAGDTGIVRETRDARNYITPTHPTTGDIQNNNGTLASGTVSSVTSADNTYHQIAEDAGENPGFDVLYTFTGITGTPKVVVFEGRYQGNAGHTVRLSVWDYNTSGWDNLDTLVHATSDGEKTLVLTPADHVSGGNLKIRIWHDGAGSAGHNLYVDYLAIRYDYSGDEIGGVTVAGTSAYPFKDATNPYLLVGTQVLSPTVFPAGDITTGSLTTTDTSAGVLSLTGTTIGIIGTNSAYDTTYINTSGYVKSLGLLHLSTVTTNGGSAAISGWHTAAVTNNIATGFAFMGVRQSVGLYGNGGHINGQVIGTLTDATNYTLASIAGGHDSNSVPFKIGDTAASYTYGTRQFIKGGSEYPTWTSVWKETSSSNTTPIYGVHEVYGNLVMAFDGIKIPTNPISSTIFQPYFLDSFTDTTGDTLDAQHTPDVTTAGGGWTKRISDSVFDIDTDEAELETDGTNPAILPVNGRYIYSTTISDGLFDVKVDCDTTNTQKNGVFYRGEADGATGTEGYLFAFRGDGTNCDLYLTDYDDDGGTDIYSNAAGTYVNGTAYTMTVQAIGSIHRLYVAGVKAGSDITDATHNTGVRFGLWADTTSNTNRAFDTASVFCATATSGSGCPNYDSILNRY